jgi:hypothetical protein
MSGRFRRWLFPLLIAALAITSVSASGTTSARPKGLPDCLGRPRTQPAAIVFACADANFGARHLRWTGWGRGFTAAVGTAYANDCDPTCVEGTFHTYRAIVVASGSQECPDGTLAYERVTIGFVGPSPYPDAKPRDLVYPLRCAA